MACMYSITSFMIRLTDSTDLKLQCCHKSVHAYGRLPADLLALASGVQQHSNLTPQAFQLPLINVHEGQQLDSNRLPPQGPLPNLHVDAKQANVSNLAI